MREYMHTHLHPLVSTVPPVQPSAAGNMEAASKLGLNAFKNQLNLSDAQQKTVMEVLDEYGKFYQNIEDQRQDVALHGVRRMMDCMTEPQKQKFEKMLGMKQKP